MPVRCRIWSRSINDLTYFHCKNIPTKKNWFYCDVIPIFGECIWHLVLNLPFERSPTTPSKPKSPSKSMVYRTFGYSYHLHAAYCMQFFVDKYAKTLSVTSPPNNTDPTSNYCNLHEKKTSKHLPKHLCAFCN